MLIYSTLYKIIRQKIARIDFLLRFEERLQGKSENITKELLKLNGRVKELEDLGEMKNIQQYTYEVRYTHLYINKQTFASTR